jgi:hypothetical protein
MPWLCGVLGKGNGSTLMFTGMPAVELTPSGFTVCFDSHRTNRSAVHGLVDVHERCSRFADAHAVEDRVAEVHHAEEDECAGDEKQRNVVARLKVNVRFRVDVQKDDAGDHEQHHGEDVVRWSRCRDWRPRSYGERSWVL